MTFRQLSPNKGGGASVGNDPKLYGNMVFDLSVAPEQRKMGGPRPPCQGYSDVALVRVKLIDLCQVW